MTTSVQVNQPAANATTTQEAVKPEDATQEAAKTSKVDKLYYFHKVWPAKNDTLSIKAVKIIASAIILPLIGALFMDVINNFKNYIWNNKIVDAEKETQETQETQEAKKEEETKIPEKVSSLNRIRNIWTNHKVGLLTTGGVVLAAILAARFSCSLPLINRLCANNATPDTATPTPPPVPKQKLTPLPVK